MAFKDGERRDEAAFSARLWRMSNAAWVARAGSRWFPRERVFVELQKPPHTILTYAELFCRLLIACGAHSAKPLHEKCKLALVYRSTASNLKDGWIMREANLSKACCGAIIHANHRQKYAV